MAVTAKWFGRALEGQWGTTAARRVDWGTDTIKTSLHTVTYTPNQDADDFFNDATNEVTYGAATPASAVTLAGKTVAYDTSTNETRLDANDASWTGASFTSRYAITWSDTAGANTTDPVLGYVDFGGDETVSSGTFTVQWDATGVLKVTAA